MPVVRHLCGYLELCSRQRDVVLGCSLSALIVPLIQVLQFHSENATLNSFHSHIEPREDMLISFGRSVIAPQPNNICQLRIVGSYSTSLAESSEVFTRTD